MVIAAAEIDPVELRLAVVEVQVRHPIREVAEADGIYVVLREHIRVNTEADDLDFREVETAEIHLYFSMLVTVPRAQRIPTLKDQMRDHDIAQPSYGLLGYPILQAADILCVKGDLVPVGRDQESHIELTREIARRFNELFAPVFPVPDALIPDERLLPGTDGSSKMSKSLDNAIDLADEPETVRLKVKSMYTDPGRIRATDPGRVEGNPVFIYHDAFNDDSAQVEDLKARYRTGKVGDVEVKQRLYEALERFLAPIRERRARYERDPKLVERGREEDRAEVPVGDDAHHPPLLVHHREVAEVVVPHQLPRPLGRLLVPDGDHPLDHHVAHLHRLTPIRRAW